VLEAVNIFYQLTIQGGVVIATWMLTMPFQLALRDLRKTCMQQEAEHKIYNTVHKRL
jgi:hypothetical protein